MVLKFDISVAKELKLNIRKVSGLILMFVEFRGEKLVRSLFSTLTPIVNRVKSSLVLNSHVAKSERVALSKM